MRPYWLHAIRVPDCQLMIDMGECERKKFGELSGLRKRIQVVRREKHEAGRQGKPNPHPELVI